ncbi:MAG: ATP-binding protein [Caldilineaceae bacterium SB0664_bin_27]|uniref:ATP-binding protein n=1 Tax=Caldilineaceae bacterium SB0664_bin_27 TaxID=2605260 RepID=A0A6B0YPR0_9CHLR|nr:ATP-binding protein [Caldilineaceae bacterium SB0664_bin_27]
MTQIYSQAEEYFLEEIEIDMGSTFWLDADMCAVFGAILYSLGDNLNTVNLVNVQPSVERILSKNGFLSHYGRVKIPDSWGTTIAYQRFDVTDDRFFSGYIEAEFIHRIEMPEMSTGLLKKFRESIFEIFSNAVLHSRTRLGIFSCGQFFPRRNKLDFTVADLGVGIRQNVCEYTGLNLSASQAIAWATVEKNTTKGGSVPGGLGLKLLGEFIDLNGGSLQIVSDDGYWQRVNRNSSSYSLGHRFPGTVVNIEINTADTHSYVLTSELDVDDIF